MQIDVPITTAVLWMQQDDQPSSDEPVGLSETAAAGLRRTSTSVCEIGRLLQQEQKLFLRVGCASTSVFCLHMYGAHAATAVLVAGIRSAATSSHVRLLPSSLACLYATLIQKRQGLQSSQLASLAPPAPMHHAFS